MHRPRGGLLYLGQGHVQGGVEEVEDLGAGAEVGRIHDANGGVDAGGRRHDCVLSGEAGVGGVGEATGEGYPEDREKELGLGCVETSHIILHTYLLRASSTCRCPTGGIFLFRCDLRFQSSSGAVPKTTNHPSLSSQQFP